MKRPTRPATRSERDPALLGSDHHLRAAMTAPHREDVKAALRKRHGSIAAFERAAGLAPKSVSDVLRGRRNPATEDAIRAEFTVQSTHRTRRASVLDTVRLISALILLIDALFVATLAWEMMR